MPSKKTLHSLSLVWIRRDLRLVDHHALSAATRESDQVALVFVFDTTILSKLSQPDDQRVQFIHETLQELDLQLKEKNSRLIVLHGDPVKEIPSLAKKLKVDAVYFNEDYEPQAKERDETVRDRLWKMKIHSTSLKDQVIFAGHEVKKNDGTPYRVFTPYKNAWLKKLSSKDVQPHSVKGKFLSTSQLSGFPTLPSLSKIGFKKTDPTPYTFQSPGRSTGLRALKQFKESLSRYHQDRDFPSISKGTSGLSVHLRFGTLSIRECVNFARSSRSKGAQVWLSELIWREFYQMILDQFPHVEQKAFLSQYQNLKWKGKAQHFKAWKEGRTGYPLVDAAMRQLNQTGWMHNRLRMVTASFLVKDLLIDWRKGESYFAEKLLDFDLSANNGGWQWSASTGCDAQPYFRIFHPVSQSKKFDADGEFIRQWVPELRELSAKVIHFPAEAKPQLLPEGFQLGKDYPLPIVDHAIQRKLALELFKTAPR